MSRTQIGVRSRSSTQSLVSRRVVAVQPEPHPWTPEPLPDLLPTPGGVEPTPVGAAKQPAPPVEVDSPQAPGTPGAEGTPPGDPADGVIVVDPAEPAQPVGTPEAAATPMPDEAVAATVRITPEFVFDPNEVTIAVGETVSWVNEGRSPQTVTLDPARADDPDIVILPEGAESWSSGVINAGVEFQYTFEVAGEYQYFSMPQEANGMTGRVNVEE